MQNSLHNMLPLVLKKKRTGGIHMHAHTHPYLWKYTQETGGLDSPNLTGQGKRGHRNTSAPFDFWTIQRYWAFNK